MLGRPPDAPRDDLPPALLSALWRLHGRIAFARAARACLIAFTAAAGLPPAESAVVPVMMGEAEAALKASQLLEAEGFLVVAIRPPTVPEKTARLRFTFSAAHPDAEITRLADIVRARILGNA